MTLRDFLDAILTFIESETLTDDEYDTVTLTAPGAYTKETYEQLKLILESRETVSGQGKKLKLYFIAKGVDLSGAPPVHISSSNILIGGEL